MRRIFRTHRATRVRPGSVLTGLRHTYGTELAAAGIDLLVLRELMGHASPETTAAYVHLSPRPWPRSTPRPGAATDERSRGCRAATPPARRRARRLRRASWPACRSAPDAKRYAATPQQALLDAHPDLAAWMERPDHRAARRSVAAPAAWPFVRWCFLEGVARPTSTSCLAKTPGDLYMEWGAAPSR